MICLFLLCELEAGKKRRYILDTDSTGLADGLNVGGGKKKNEGIYPSDLRKMVVHFLSWSRTEKIKNLNMLSF